MSDAAADAAADPAAAPTDAGAAPVAAEETQPKAAKKKPAAAKTEKKTEEKEGEPAEKKTKEKKAEKKKKEKEEEEEEQEEGEDDDDEEKDEARPLSARSRKSVTRFIPFDEQRAKLKAANEAEPPPKPGANDTTLGSIEGVGTGLGRHGSNDEVLILLHRALYGRDGKASERKARAGSWLCGALPGVDCLSDCASATCASPLS
jgi:hypothetical protein